MNFDQFTVALLILRADAPKLSEKEENALQDAHMAHVAKLHDEGHLLAAGPILGTSDRELRGLSIFRGSPSDAKVLADQDPGVLAGKYTHQLFSRAPKRRNGDSRPLGPPLRIRGPGHSICMRVAPATQDHTQQQAIVAQVRSRC